MSSSEESEAQSAENSFLLSPGGRMKKVWKKLTETFSPKKEGRTKEEAEKLAKAMLAQNAGGPRRSERVLTRTLMGPSSQ